MKVLLAIDGIEPAAGGTAEAVLQSDGALRTPGPLCLVAPAAGADGRMG